MARRTLPWLPWLLAEGTLVWLRARLWPYSGLWLLLVWTVLLLLYRAAVSQASHRSLRLVGDLVFAGLCALAVFEGGWYLLPAVVLFAVADAAGVSASLPSLPGGREGHELGAALGSTVVGWLALAFFLSGPLYGSASSTIGPNGTTGNSGPTTQSLLQVGLTAQAAVVLAACAVLFGLVAVLTVVHVKTRRNGAWRLLVAATIGLLVLVVLGAWTVGLWLVPGAALALLAVRFGRPAGGLPRLLRRQEDGTGLARRPVRPAGAGDRQWRLRPPCLSAVPGALGAGRADPRRQGPSTAACPTAH